MRLTLIAGILTCASALTGGNLAANTLRGTVLAASDFTPLEHAEVFVDVVNPDSVRFSATTDSTGTFTVSGLPSGNRVYQITCLLDGYAPFRLRYDDLATGDRDADILMRPPDPPLPGPPTPGDPDSLLVDGVVFTDIPGSGPTPVAGATLTFAAGTKEYVATTSANGRYSIHMGEGSYAFTVTAPGYATVAGSGLQVVPGGLTLSIALSHLTSADGAGTGSETFSLAEPYPNPFNPSTVIRFGLPVSTSVRVTVWTLLGQEVAELFNGFLEAGVHEIVFDASGLAGGMYLGRFEAGNYVAARKLNLVK
jgi:hypothetical protein